MKLSVIVFAVSVLATCTAFAADAGSVRIRNDSDARLVPGRRLALRGDEATVTALVQSVHEACEHRDLKSLRAAFEKIATLSHDELPVFTGVFREARRMLQMPMIQPIEVTAPIAELLEMLDRLEARG